MPVTAQKAGDRLNTPEAIAGDLNAAPDEMVDDPGLLMKALRDVAEAQGGVTQLAERAGRVQAALSRVLSSQRCPRINIPSKVIGACGIKLSFAT